MIRSPYIRVSAACAVLALAGLIAGSAHAEGWGTIKGKIAYDGKPPVNPEVAVDADKGFCTKNGKIYRNEWVVDPKDKGVKWVLVWLTEEKNASGKSTAFDPKKIHPTLKAVPKQVVIDQPFCTFLPRMTAMRAGSDLIVKNSATVPHNTSFQGGALGPTLNQLIPAGKELEVKDIKARGIPFSYSCSIHRWMKGWIGVFEHPYYAITNEKGEFEIKNAPEGKFRLMVWHEGAGFIQKSSTNRGIVITIVDKKVTEVPAAALKIKADE